MLHPKLAASWPVAKVRECLDNKQEAELLRFIKARFKERFFRPISYLKQAPGNLQGYGFAIIALCSLLVESLQSFRDGLPSTHYDELRHLGRYNPPAEFEIPRIEWPKNGAEVFQRFFRTYRGLFTGVDGLTFYLSIRCGLLHQTQTKNGWTLRTGQKFMWNSSKRILDRDAFAESIEDAFKSYVKELEHSQMDHPVWQRARRKIWWLIRLSE
jgi:hypothetical protein